MWKFIPKHFGLGMSKVHPWGQQPRQWPLFTFLLILVLLPSLIFILFSSWSHSLIKPPTCQDHKYDVLFEETRFGDILIPTPWQQAHSPLGSHVYKLGRALDIINCSNIRLNGSNILVPQPNNTTFLKDRCPIYFHWLYRDLAPWKHTGITQSNIEAAKKYAAFKVVILNGQLYVDLYHSCFQTRILFTIWGILMLLEKYNGQVPDVEFMFNCMDRPGIKKLNDDTKEISRPPLLLSYCSTHNHHDVPFPDWSFWGWSELQLESWDQELDKIIRGSREKHWREKFPKAYWSGNPYVGSPIRTNLVQCDNATKSARTEVHIQDWEKELNLDKKNSKLEDQCTHKYMIYVEGIAWSVSLKYIMACGSPTLVMATAYYDFFMRGLKPWVHYIPVHQSKHSIENLCEAIGKEVDFGEANPLKTIEIGKVGQDFVNKELSMTNVYDYMFHLFHEYATLQKFHPSIPKTAQLVTQDYLLCLSQPLQRLLLQQARKLIPSSLAPCQLQESLGDDFKESKWATKENEKRSVMLGHFIMFFTILIVSKVNMLAVDDNENLQMKEMEIKID